MDGCRKLERYWQKPPAEDDIGRRQEAVKKERREWKREEGQNIRIEQDKKQKQQAIIFSFR